MTQGPDKGGRGEAMPGAALFGRGGTFGEKKEYRVTIRCGRWW